MYVERNKFTRHNDNLHEIYRKSDGKLKACFYGFVPGETVFV